MTQALTSRTPHLEDSLDGYVSVLNRLATKWAVTVTYGPVPAHLVGVFDSTTRTVQLRPDAPIEDQMWLLLDAWLMFNYGADVAVAARLEPHLYLVPAPRSAN